MQDILRELIRLSNCHGVIRLEVQEQTVSILKARAWFSELICIQVYFNNSRSKTSYSLIANDQRMYGRDNLESTEFSV